MLKCYKKGYPRPQLTRADWTDLNGIWDFAFDDGDVGLAQRWYDSFPTCRSIVVPFSYQCRASGIGDTAVHRVVWYRRTLDLDRAALAERRLMLVFEGCDYHTDVWVDGRLAGSHDGGYTRFALDVTDLLGANPPVVTVRAYDAPDTAQPRGKQRWQDESYGCWYVPTTGIWKPVWMEVVDAVRITDLRLTPDVGQGCLDIQAQLTDAAVGSVLDIEVGLQGKALAHLAVGVDGPQVKARVCLPGQELYDWGLKLWSPLAPNLYDLDLRVIKDGQVRDRVGSYFGLRDVAIQGGDILVDGMPMYQRLILDQGYWADSGLTAPSEQALIDDLDRILALGYNGLRIHQKIEDERLLYWCDVKGLMVWSEMPAQYDFSPRAVAAFTAEWTAAVAQNYSHPSVIVWVPFNESWGLRTIRTDKAMQDFTVAIYHLTKALDPMRPVVSNDGWDQTVTDIVTLHDYQPDGPTLTERYTQFKDDILAGRLFHCGDHAAMVPGFGYHGQPVVISEFGGIAMSGAAGWGYGETVADEAAFIKRFDAITTAIKRLPYVAGYCYTQLTDVQQEVNGLLDHDHGLKVDGELIRQINLRPVGQRDAYTRK